MGFTDLHLHLLPGVDDGARTMDEALAMARALVALGFSHAAPSPHNRAEYASQEECLNRLVEVQTALADAGIPLVLEENSENFFLDEGLLAALATPTARKVGSVGAYLLVEAPYTTTLPTLREILFRVKLKGVTPLIAHPERCLQFEKKGQAAEAVAAGAVLQLDIGALIGRYGATAKKLAKTFLDEGLYAIAATDLHSPVGAEQWVGESIAALEKGWGKKAVQTLLNENPAAILRGEALPGFG